MQIDLDPRAARLIESLTATAQETVANVTATFERLIKALEANAAAMNRLTKAINELDPD